MWSVQDNVIPPFARAVIIYNPEAGGLRGEHKTRLQQASKELRGTAQEILFMGTEGPRTAGALAAKAIEGGADLIVAAGGDGTISEVVDGMALSRVPLAILPAGTANVLAHEAGLERGVVGAARQLSVCMPARISLGQVETASGARRYFLLMAGAGFDARVIYRLNAGWKQRWGLLSYYFGGLASLGGRLDEMRVTFNGSSRNCTFALLSKVRNYGGSFEIASQADLRSDRFQIVLFDGRNSWRYLRYLAAVATKSLLTTPGVSFAFSDCVSLEPLDNGRVHLQVDGELISEGLPATVRIVPDALTLLLPVPRR